MTFDATRTSEHPWMQSHICQEEQLGCTGDFSSFQPKDLVVMSGLVSRRTHNSQRYHISAQEGYFRIGHIFLLPHIYFTGILATELCLHLLQPCSPFSPSPTRTLSSYKTPGSFATCLRSRSFTWQPATISRYIPNDLKIAPKLPNLNPLLRWSNKRSSPTCGRSSQAGCWR